MAKIIKYNLCTLVNQGTAEKPQMVEIFSPVVMGWNEANEAIAAKEAHNGEYTIEDDGEEETKQQPTLETRVDILETNSAEMAEALDMILNGVSE